MSFDPKPGYRIHLNGTDIIFDTLDNSVFLYAEDGKEGTVYRVRKGGQPYALKVFYPNYQNERLIGNSLLLSKYKTLGGLRVAERVVITKQTFPQLVKTFPELEFAILMPWIQGNIWGNIFMDHRYLPVETYLAIGRAFVHTLDNLEASGIAHCDLSNNNFIISSNFSCVELIDIESMYAPNMPRPIPDVSFGTPGYRTRWIAENGLWGPASDRFACAVLCAEILTWHLREVREAKAGLSSFFSEEDISNNCSRYQIIRKSLEKLNPGLCTLFEKAWFAKQPCDCPSIKEWRQVIDQGISSGSPRHESEPLKKNDNLNPRQPIAIEFEGNVISGGTPARMEIDLNSLQFGIIDRANTSLKLKISNTGGSILSGNITPENWIGVSTQFFRIDPGKNIEIIVSIKGNLPKTQSKYEFRSASALIIESNVGVEVLGATFSLPKRGLFG